MKRKSLLRKTLSLLVVLMLLLSSISVAVYAAGPSTTVLLSSFGYSETTKTYTAKDTFESGEVAYLQVSTTTVVGLSTLEFVINYDMDSLEFNLGKSSCMINNKNSTAYYRVEEDNKRVRVTYNSDLFNSGTSVTGPMFYLAFNIKKATEGKTIPVTMEIVDFFDDTRNQNDYDCNKTASVTLKIASDGISTNALNLFRALKPENMKYPDSADDIAKAKTAFDSFTAEQKSGFINNYPEEYEWFTMADYHYNRLAEQASQTELKAEIAKFLNDHATALALTTDTVKIADETIVSAAETALYSLSAQAKLKLQGEEKLLRNLSARISALKEAEVEIADFLGNTNYNQIFDRTILTNGTFDTYYTTYNDAVVEALINYSVLGEDAKKAVADEYEWVMKVKAACEELIAADKAEEALSQKVTDFMTTYAYVFTLSEANVAVEDKSAIQMVLDAYDALTDTELKDRLKARTDNMKVLLEIIEEFAVLDDTDTDTDIEPEIITETVYETEYETKIETVTKTITNTIKQMLGGGKEFSLPIYILLLATALDIILLFVIYTLSQAYKKKLQNKANAFNEIPEVA